MVLTVALAQIKPSGWALNGANLELKEKLRAHIKRFGQLADLVVREVKDGFYEIIDGNKRYDVLMEAGFKTANVISFFEMNDDEAIRLAIEINTLRFPLDEIKLAEGIKKLSKVYSIDDMARSMPFSEYEIENYPRLFDFDWDTFSPTDKNQTTFDFNA